jgi:preprotein translocase subunit SecB
MKMKPSNVQTKATVFAGIEIKPVPEEFADVTGFEWAGVNIGIQTRHEHREDKSHLLSLRFIVDNEKGKPAPYAMDIQVMGLFEYRGSDPEEQATDLVVVNGLSILYGAIRELCTTLTSRMPHGAICLPGANFLDHRPSLKKKAAKTAVPIDENKAVPKKPSRRKSLEP